LAINETCSHRHSIREEAGSRGGDTGQGSSLRGRGEEHGRGEEQGRAAAGGGGEGD